MGETGKGHKNPGGEWGGVRRWGRLLVRHHTAVVGLETSFLPRGNPACRGTFAVASRVSSTVSHLRTEHGTSLETPGCLRKGTPLASRVARGVSGPSSSCVWNPRVSGMMTPGDPGAAPPVSLLCLSTGLAAPLPHFFKNYFLLDPCSVLKCETVLDTLDATSKVP